jgi:23S rRNA (guanosine2251-2'-O)-methyltransferase
LEGKPKGPLLEIVEIATEKNIKVIWTTKRDLSSLSGAGVHQGVVAFVNPFAYSSLENVLERGRAHDRHPLILALDSIQDPHNLGALVRSALALGADGVLIPKDRACEVTAVAAKSSAGAVAHLPIVRVTNLKRTLTELQKEGFWLVGTVADGGQPLQSLDFLQPIVLIIGSEGKGIRQKLAEACDFRARIPMVGDIGSLNAASAGSICLYEVLRQRAQK